MSSITLGELTPNDIGKRVTISSAHAVISGALRDLRVDTDWVTTSRMDQHPDDAEQVPGRKTVSVSVGEWSAEPAGQRERGGGAMTITEFLTARYDEEEAMAREDLARIAGSPRRNGKTIARRLVADIAAKRAIVELAGRATEADRRMLAAEGAADPGPPYIGDPFLWALAQPFADHPGFDPAWRVE